MKPIARIQVTITMRVPTMDPTIILPTTVAIHAAFALQNFRTFQWRTGLHDLFGRKARVPVPKRGRTGAGCSAIPIQ